jgi:sporulation protein YlmC with PRC-barrel domain
VPDERLNIGAEVLASDGECGRLERVIIDPVAQKLTHLVVAPKHHGGLDKLVPVHMVDAVEGDHIQLSCTRAQFAGLDDAEDTQFLPTDSNVLGYQPGNALLWPFFSRLTPGLSHHAPILSDRIPMAEVEVNRGDQVHATDGFIGSVHGLVIDPADQHVTHVLLQEGHPWGHKQVAIPIGATAKVGDEIEVELTKQQIEQLPPVELG